MKKVLKVLGILFLVIFIMIGGGMIYLLRGLDDGLNQQVNEVNLENIKDGTYEGSFTNGRWTNELVINIQEHKINDIHIKDDVTFVKPEVSSELFSNVINNQSTMVEVVSGATVTSKAYLKSIENALNK